MVILNQLYTAFESTGGSCWQWSVLGMGEAELCTWHYHPRMQQIHPAWGSDGVINDFPLGITQLTDKLCLLNIESTAVEPVDTLWQFPCVSVAFIVIIIIIQYIINNNDNSIALSLSYICWDSQRRKKKPRSTVSWYKNPCLAQRYLCVKITVKSSRDFLKWYPVPVPNVVPKRCGLLITNGDGH